MGRRSYSFYYTLKTPVLSLARSVFFWTGWPALKLGFLASLSFLQKGGTSRCERGFLGQRRYALKLVFFDPLSFLQKGGTSRYERGFLREEEVCAEIGFL